MLKQLSSLFNFAPDNRTPHALCPNHTYEHILDVLRTFKRIGVSDEDLLTCKVKIIYAKVLEKMNCHNYSIEYRLLHADFLPNYLKSFNYKTHFDLLPVKSKFMHYGLDNDSRCRVHKILKLETGKFKFKEINGLLPTRIGNCFTIASTEIPHDHGVRRERSPRFMNNLKTGEKSVQFKARELDDVKSLMSNQGFDIKDLTFNVFLDVKSIFFSLLNLILDIFYSSTCNGSIDRAVFSLTILYAVGGLQYLHCLFVYNRIF